MDRPLVGQMSKVQIEAMENTARVVFRTLGPRISAADSMQDQVSARFCPICDPKPREYTCPVCDFSTTAQWQLKNHVIMNPEYCQRRGEQKVRAWANKS